MSTYVSIGRNIQNEPMSEHDWGEFVKRVTLAVELFAGPIVSTTLGSGVYQGKTEGCAVIVGAGNPAKHSLSYLKASLSALATSFKQECIALTVATPEFIS